MMMINRRRAYGGKSLPYDYKVEYLESSGTQYIDTGVYANGKIRMLAHIKTKKDGGPNSAFSGVIHKNFTGIWQVVYSYMGVDFNVSQQEIVFSFPYIGEQVFDVDQVNRTITLNGVTQEMTNIPMAVQPGYDNIPLCKYNNRLNNFNNFWIGEVYYAKIYDNNTLVRDFIPVSVGNVGYMYDKVSGQLFGNQGTGSFIVGQRVS
jgi:hypothetical protein